ncbi:RNA-binding protein [Erysipelotrichaceae bacterium]|nr:RNA-binding protein [Erysipelotrichaceae bacterium]
MLTNKQQKFIRSQAQKIKATAQIGKNELSESAIESIGKLLEANELVKVHLLAAAVITKKEAIAILTDTFYLEYAYSIGNQLVIYKQSRNQEKRIFSKSVESK